MNITKTVAILFTKRRPLTPLPLRFHHTDIPWSPHIRYLGLELDSKFLSTKHINTVTHKATGVLLKLFPILGRDSTLSSHNKLNLYKLLIRPILTYAAPVWSNTSSSNYRLLQILQSKCLRFFNQNFFELLVTIPGVLPSPTSIPLSILNLYTSLFTVCRKNFSTPAPLTQILSSAK